MLEYGYPRSGRSTSAVSENFNADLQVGDNGVKEIKMSFGTFVLSFQSRNVITRQNVRKREEILTELLSHNISRSGRVLLSNAI